MTNVSFRRETLPRKKEPTGWYISVDLIGYVYYVGKFTLKRYLKQRPTYNKAEKWIENCWKKEG